MKPTAFRYTKASGLDDAVRTLQAEEDAKIIAGGQSLVPLMNFRLSRPQVLVDIAGIAKLHIIEDNAQGLRLGALTTHQTLVTHPVIREKNPFLSHVASHIGHWAIRNRGTLGGSLAHADPAAELPAAMVAFNAVIHLYSSQGTRTIASREFFLGFLTTVLGEHEMIVQVDIPDTGSSWGFDEIVRRPGDFAMAGAIVELTSPNNGAITWFGISGKPEYKAVTHIPDQEDARKSFWQMHLEDMIFTTDSTARRQMAIKVAEGAYQQAKGAGAL